jgi:hypothetical protein
LLLLLVGSLVAAQAQDESKPATVELGNTEISGSVTLAGHASSNPAQASSSPFPGVAALITPSLSIRNEGATHRAGVEAALYVRKYFNRRATPYDRLNDFSVNADVETGLQLPVGFRASYRGGARRDAFGGYNPRSNTLHLHNGVEGRALFRAQSLTFYGGGHVSHDLFSSPDGSRDNQLLPGADAGAEWLIFPRSALVLDLEWTEVLKSGTSGMENGRHLRAITGLRGRTTERTVIELTAGYGVALYPSGGATGLDGILVTAQLRHALTERQSVALSYSKDFESVPFTNVVAYHSFKANFHSVQEGGFTWDLVLDPRIQLYRGPVTRTDFLVRAAADVRYELRPGVGLVGGLYATDRISGATSQGFLDVGGQVGVKLGR